MEIYSSSYQQMEFDEANGILKETYLPASSNYDKESFKTDHLNLGQEVKKSPKVSNFKSLLVDMRQLNFTISPDLQQWHGENIFPIVVEVGVKKMAIVVSSNVFTEVSVKQTVDDFQGVKFETRYFQAIDEAEKWLKE